MTQTHVSSITQAHWLKTEYRGDGWYIPPPLWLVAAIPVLTKTRHEERDKLRIAAQILACR